MQAKRKSKRRPQHGLSYYERAIAASTSADEVLDLRLEAALQPLKILSNESFTRVYWQAHEKIKRLEKGERA